MKPLNTKSAHLFIALACLLAVTRPHHFGSLHHLPNASLAVFFLLGAWLQSRAAFVGMLLLATGIDAVILAERGGMHHCITSAYAAMPLAYAALWMGGRWLRQQGRFGVAHPVSVSLVLLACTSAAFVLSSGAFHFFSGRVPNPDWAGFVARTEAYFPRYVRAPFLFTAVALFAQGLLARAASSHPDGERGQ